MARGLFAVLESELETEVVAAPEVERVEELEDQVSQAATDELGGESDVMAETIDDAVTAIEELSEVGEILEGSVEEGSGLTEEAAEIAEVAVESICSRLGYTAAKRVIPAMESFGATSSRLDATKFALENVRELASRVWEAIKKFFTNLWDHIKAFWAQLISTVERYRQRSVKFGQKLEELKKNDATVKDGYKFKADKFMVAFNTKDANHLQANVLKAMSGDAVSLTDLNGINDKLSKLTVISDDKSMNVDLQASELKLNSFANKSLPFGYQLVVEEDKVSFKQNKLNITSVESTPDAISGLLLLNVQIAKMCKTVQELEKNMGKAENVVKTIIKTADKLAKHEEASAEMKEKAEAFKKAGSIFSTFNSKLPGIYVKATGVALDYIAVNMAGYEKKAAEKA